MYKETVNKGEIKLVGERNYKADFEVYPDPTCSFDNMKVEIYIGIN